MEALAEEFSGRAKIVKINADDELELCKQYNVRGLPTLLIFNGGQFENVSSMRSKGHFTALIEGHLAGQKNDDVFEENLDDSEMRKSFLSKADIDRVRKRLATQPELGLDPYEEGTSPISIAILTGDQKRIQLILELDPKLSLGNLAALGDVAGLKSALAEDASAIDEDEGTIGPPLAQAIQCSQWDTAKMLIDAGAQIDIQSLGYYSVVPCALRSGRQALDLLYANGLLAKALEADTDGNDSLLFMAVMFGSQIEIVEQLLSDGFSPDTIGSAGFSPIKFAQMRVEKGTDEKAKKLDQSVLDTLRAAAENR